MSGHTSHKKLYFAVFGVLTFLTILELFVPGMSVAKSLKFGMLMTLAGVKALLVAYYFMHLNEESNWMRFIAAIPISAAFYTLVVALETVFR